MKLSLFTSVGLTSLISATVNAFSITQVTPLSRTSTTHLYHGPPSSTTTAEGFLATELRSAAMKLHTTMQAPKEGGVKVQKPKEPHVTTRMEYLKFLVDSQHVYAAFEEVLKNTESSELTPFQQTGLERTDRLEQDIVYLCETYEELERPAVGGVGTRYAQEVRRMGQDGKEAIPEFMNHYYNHYFAHTAGGIMIGKQMSKLLLDSKTLEFYKWDSDINELKVTVKNSIEELAATWTREQKDACVDATAAAFQGGGSLNSYLGGGSGE